MQIDREVNVMAQLLRETPKANYPLQLLKDALLTMSERTSGVGEALLIVEQVARGSATLAGRRPAKCMQNECSPHRALRATAKDWSEQDQGCPQNDVSAHLAAATLRQELISSLSHLQSYRTIR